MKKIVKMLVLTTLTLLSATPLSAERRARTETGNKERVIEISELEWKRLRKELDSTHVGRIPEHNTTIVVTNAIPPVVHYWPSRGNRLRSKDEIEPLPYAGQ